MPPSANPSKRPRTASRAVRRRQLIEATISSIAQNGLTGTTMATVTGLANLSMGLVSFHFNGKENLLEETLVYLAEEHRTGWIEGLESAELEPGAKLAAIVDAHFDPSVCNETRIAVWFAFFGDARYREIYREKITKFDDERSRAVTKICREIISARGLGGLDPAAISSSIESFADGLWLSIMLYPNFMTRDGAKRRIHEYLAAIFPDDFTTWPGEADCTATAPAGCNLRMEARS